MGAAVPARRRRPPRRAEYGEKTRALLADGRRGDALALFMTIVGLPPEAIAGARQSPYWAQGESLAPTLAYDAAVMGDGSIPVERYAEITVPTAVLAGGASPDWFRDAGRAAAAAVRGATYGELAGQTHDVAPDVLAAAVRELTGTRTSYAGQP